MSLPFWDYKRVKNEWVHSIVIKKKTGVIHSLQGEINY